MFNTQVLLFVTAKIIGSTNATLMRLLRTELTQTILQCEFLSDVMCQMFR